MRPGRRLIGTNWAIHGELIGLIGHHLEARKSATARRKFIAIRTTFLPITIFFIQKVVEMRASGSQPDSGMKLRVLRTTRLLGQLGSLEEKDEGCEAKERVEREKGNEGKGMRRRKGGKISCAFMNEGVLMKAVDHVLMKIRQCRFQAHGAG